MKKIFNDIIGRYILKFICYHNFIAGVIILSIISSLIFTIWIPFLFAIICSYIICLLFNFMVYLILDNFDWFSKYNLLISNNTFHRCYLKDWYDKNLNEYKNEI